MTLAITYHIEFRACTCTIAVKIPQLQHLIPDQGNTEPQSCSGLLLRDNSRSVLDPRPQRKQEARVGKPPITLLHLRQWLVAHCVQGSAWRGSKYFYFATYPGSLIALIPDPSTVIPIPVANGSGISSRVEVNSHIVSSYNTLFATRIFNTPDPRSIGSDQLLV